MRSLLSLIDCSWYLGMLCTKISILRFNSVNCLNTFISTDSNTLLDWFYLCIILSFATAVIIFHPLQFLYFHFFHCCFIFFSDCTSTFSNKMFNCRCNNRYTHPSSNFKESASNLSPLSMMFLVIYSQITFVRLWKIIFLQTAKNLYHELELNFLCTFSTSI